MVDRPSQGALISESSWPSGAWGSWRMVRAFSETQVMPKVVRATQITVRYSQPEMGGRPAMPCATPTVKGLSIAPAKPMPAPISGMATPMMRE